MNKTCWKSVCLLKNKVFSKACSSFCTVRGRRIAPLSLKSEMISDGDKKPVRRQCRIFLGVASACMIRHIRPCTCQLILYTFHMPLSSSPTSMTCTLSHSIPDLWSDEVSTSNQARITYFHFGQKVYLSIHTSALWHGSVLQRSRKSGGPSHVKPCRQ